MAGLIALVTALVVATAIGLALRWRSGKFRTAGASRTSDLAPGSSTPVDGDAVASSGQPPASSGQPAASSGQPAADADLLTEADLGAELGERATLVQFSTVFCAPCRPTRLILAQVAEMVDGVRHVDIDATERMDLVGRLRINSTPTILVLGPGGIISKRASGLPRKADVIAALGQVIDPDPSTTSTSLIDNKGNAS
jgi:thiol-disulfide isomerase/thioredoxin